MAEKRPTTPVFEVLTITPAMAGTMLAGQSNVRRTQPNRVAAYAADMRAGRWPFTGEPVMFNGTRLLNGFHRLSACIEADVPFTTAIVRNVEESALPFIDAGLKRSITDALRGTVNAALVAGSSRLLIGWESGILMQSKSMAQIARSAIIDFANTHAEAIRAAIPPSQAVYRQIGGSGSAWTAVYYRLPASRRDEFYRALETGENLSAGDPRLALRSNVLSRARLGVAKRAEEWVYQAIKTWNSWATGQSITHLKPALTGLNAKIPEIARAD